MRRPFVRLFKRSKVRSRRQNYPLLHTCETCYSDASVYGNVLRNVGVETAFKRNLKLPFVESDVLRKVVPYLKHTLNLVDVEILSVEWAQAEAEAEKVGYSRVNIEGSELGNPRVQFIRKV